MANVQLYIENQLCDFDKKTYFNLQKEFEDEAELIVKEIEYSYTISIPTSMKNKKILGFIDDFDVPNKFGRVYNAELYVGEMLILKGKLKLTEIDREYFKGNLYNPASLTVSDILGDRMLNEIVEHRKPMNNLKDFSDQNNYVMGLQTVDIPKAKYRDKHVCYPYVLWTLPYNEPNNALDHNIDYYTQDLKYGNHTITVDNVLPAYNVCSILKDIFKTEGYNIQGNIFDDEKFKDLYQTFNYDYNKYLEEKAQPYYLNFHCDYTNLKKSTNSFSISPTMQTATLWTENEFHDGHGDEGFDGSYRAGVESPLITDKDHSNIIIRSNDQHMMTKGDVSDSYVIRVPRSGWYKFHCTGNMSYPIRQTSFRIPYFYWESYRQDNRENVGGMYDIECDRTSLEQTPFEFQIKRGSAFDHPQYYSFNAGIPCMPTHYAQFETVKSVDWGWDNCPTAVKLGTSDKQAYYGKNGKQTIAKGYSDDQTDISDFICGARLGGALFTYDYTAQYYGAPQSNNKFALRGGLMALPRAERRLDIRDFDGSKYYMVCQGQTNVSWQYGKDTAQIVLHEKGYGNFDGYNKVNFITGYWDTTSNYSARTYSTTDTSTAYTANVASTSGDDKGSWTMNTVMWLEEGENVDISIVMPQHNAGIYTCCHSEWTIRENWINMTNVSFDFEMGYINNDKKWYPNSETPIPTFADLSASKDTNVNQFLPQVKCNDFLNNFLQTFNLQLTMPNKNTFSIDYAMMNDVMGNIISIENLANIKDAHFKTLESPSTRQLSWKISKDESGYAEGNQSPYKAHNYPWYESGYTGSISITNETNTSGSIDKKESNWSYCWYKDIKFVNGLGMSISGAPVPVMAAKNTWSGEITYFTIQGEKLKTNYTSRFFFPKKNSNTSLYEYIEFKYDENNGNDLTCRLLIPSNNISTKQSDGNFRYYMLDYNNNSSNTEGGRMKTITDIFFNLKNSTAYQIDVPIKLSNDLYKRINGGTLIKFNDGLYRVKSIEGHDVLEQNDATLSLLTLK